MQIVAECSVIRDSRFSVDWELGLDGKFQGIVTGPKQFRTIAGYHFTIRLLRGESDRWLWKSNFIKESRGTAATRELAAEACYQAMFRGITETKLKEALKYEERKPVVLLGSWLTADEFHQAPREWRSRCTIVPDAAADDRSDSIFVLDWPTLGRGKGVVTAKLATQTRRTLGQSPMDWVLTLPSGTAIQNRLDWYIHRPEQYLAGELMCCSCGGVSAESCFVYAYQVGLHCFPCLDNAVDAGRVTESMYDLSDVS